MTPPCSSASASSRARAARSFRLSIANDTSTGPCVRDQRVQRAANPVSEWPDAPQRPVAELIAAFEILAGQRVLLGERHHESLEHLVHPVHRDGGVFTWEILPPPSGR